MKYIALVAVLLATVAGCSQQQSKQDQSSSLKNETASNQTSPQVETAPVPEVKLAALLADPKPYAGKEVRVTGMFNGACCATDFVLKDGLESMEVYITDQCPMPDESRKHKPMQVVGTVQLRGDEVSLIANEVMFQ